MKRWIALLFLLATPAAAEEVRISDLSGGMVSFPSANRIPDNSASYIQNFYTDIQPMLVERNGYVKRDSSVIGGTNIVSGLWAFTDVSATDWIIAFSSRTFYKASPGNAFASFGPVNTVAQVPQATINLGKIWFTNGTDNVWWFDGTSTGAVSAAPKGKLIANWRNRIAIANISGSQSTVRFSGDGDGTSWTLGGNPTDPFNIQIGGANDGQYIRCLRSSYLDSFIIGRKYDMWSVDGFDQGDYVTRNISLNVGCLEQGSIQEVDGELIWLSWRGLESMRGRNIVNISEPIRDITDTVVKNSVSDRSDIQTSQTDWNAGSQDSAGVLSTTIRSGSIGLVFPDDFSTLRNGTNGTPYVWEDYYHVPTSVTPCPQATGSISISSGMLRIVNDGLVTCSGSNSVPISLQTSEKFIKSDQILDGATFQFMISTMTLGTAVGSAPTLSFGINGNQFSEAFLGEGSLLNAPYWFYRFAATTTGQGYIDSGQNSSDSSSNLFVQRSFTLPATVQFWLNASTFSLTINGNLIKSNGHTWGGSNDLYAFWSQNPTGVAGKSTSAVDNLNVVAATVTFTSQIINVGANVGAWKDITISDVQTDGTFRYQFGSNSSASTTTITNWQDITNGAIPTVSTNPYAAFRLYVNNYSSFTPTGSNFYLSEFVTRWSEGTAAPAPVSSVYDRRYWLSFTTTTTSSPFLDTTLIWQRTKSWTMFKGVNAASFAIWRDALHFGSSLATGLVYKFDTGSNDDGSDINSRIDTKSYDFGFGHREKSFRNAWVGYGADPDFSGSFFLTQNLNRSENATSLGSANLNDGTGQLSSKFPFPTSDLTVGREVQFTVTKSGTDTPLEIYDMNVEFEPMEAQ